MTELPITKTINNNPKGTTMTSTTSSTTEPGPEFGYPYETIVAAPVAPAPTRAKRWLVPVVIASILAVCDIGVGIAMQVTHQGRHIGAVVTAGDGAVDNSYLNPDVLAEDVASSYDDGDDTTATCIQHGDKNTFDCMLTWTDSDTGEEMHTDHVVIVNDAGDTWIAKRGD